MNIQDKRANLCSRNGLVSTQFFLYFWRRGYSSADYMTLLQIGQRFSPYWDVYSLFEGGIGLQTELQQLTLNVVEDQGIERISRSWRYLNKTAPRKFIRLVHFRDVKYDNTWMPCFATQRSSIMNKLCDKRYYLYAKFYYLYLIGLLTPGNVLAVNMADCSYSKPDTKNIDDQSHKRQIYLDLKFVPVICSAD